MKFSIPFILLTTFSAVFVELNEAHYNVNLIKDVHHKYKATGVIILSGADSPSFEKIPIYHEAVRMLSREGISTLIVNFRQFKEQLRVANGIPARSLIAISIDTIGELHAFQSFTKNYDMRHGVWLILFARDASRDVCEFCRNSHKSLLNLKFDSKVLISCCGSNMIEEWWNIGENLTKRQELGRLMDGNHRIKWFSAELVNRNRYSIDGRKLTIAVVKNSLSFREKDGNYYGILAELLQELSRAMNFTVSEIIWENDYGAWNSENSTWTGVFGKIHRREADLGVSTFEMTSEVSNAVSFTSPVFLDSLQLHFRKYDDAHIVWNAQFKALTVGVWMVIIGLILITPLLLTLIRYNRRSHFFPLLFEHYLCVWGIFCQRSWPVFPKEEPSRIVHLSILASAVIASAAYSALIISSLTTPSQPPFNTIEQFVRDGTYKLAVLKNTQSSKLYQFGNQVFTKKFMSLLKSNDLLPGNIQEAFEQVCNERVAFYGSKLAKMAGEIVIPCEIISIDTGKIANMAMIMPRGSEYLVLVNYHILRFRANGIFRRLERKYYPGAQQVDRVFSQVTLQAITPILIILALVVLIALIILIIERHSYSATRNSEIIQRLRKQNRQNNSRKRFHFP